MSKYEPLWIYIKDNNKDIMTFDEIKNILGFDFDHSFLTYKKELNDYGYIIKKISMKNKNIIIEKYEKLF